MSIIVHSWDVQSPDVSLGLEIEQHLNLSNSANNYSNKLRFYFLTLQEHYYYRYPSDHNHTLTHLVTLIVYAHETPLAKRLVTLPCNNHLDEWTKNVYIFCRRYIQMKNLCRSLLFPLHLHIHRSLIMQIIVVRVRVYFTNSLFCSCFRYDDFSTASKELSTSVRGCEFRPRDRGLN